VVGGANQNIFQEIPGTSLILIIQTFGLKISLTLPPVTFIISKPRNLQCSVVALE